MEIAAAAEARDQLGFPGWWGVALFGSVPLFIVVLPISDTTDEADPGRSV